MRINTRRYRSINNNQKNREAQELEKAREERKNKFLGELNNYHFKTQVTEKPFPVLDDAELEKKIAELTPKIRLNAVLAAIFGVVGSVMGVCAYFRVINGLYILLAFLLLTVGGGFGTTARRHKNRLKCIISNNIVRGVLSEKFELDVYAPGNHIPTLLVQCACLFDSWNKISGSDLIKGTYKGVRFTFSDIHLIQEKTNSKGGKSRTTKFKGQWLVIDYKEGKELPWCVQLKERSSVAAGIASGKAIGSSTKSVVETENIEFNKRFQIIAPNPLAAFYIFTPHFMEYVLKADNRANAVTSMSFDEKQLHVALHNGRDLFEPGGKKHFAVNNIATLRMQMRWDVNYITGIIDELLLNENLFNTNQPAPLDTGE